MSRWILLFFTLAACSGGGDVSPTDGKSDASADARQPDAPIATCHDSQPPDNLYGRCGAVNNCNPPICWWCVDSMDGPQWTLAGDESCHPIARCIYPRQQWREAVANVDRSCTVDADCTLVGGISPPTCDARASIAEQCEGAAVNAAALAETDLRERASKWDQSCQRDCGSLGCVADCAPGIPRCVAGRCTVGGGQTCFPSPDAG